ncbi:hypothetical protein nbrc107696_44770 [Gordonia spumicola]|uniref:Uncharacterized protein n=1 Tax=Gordonia spumicola TaxID=589161 RepID=A0A7I9VG09_9ACTN|nr:hypothetical protein [Gordonia spumicola]GEE04031.1 hypothetical protein nbrc107696_44770 [Gordonia spumicola]
MRPAVLWVLAAVVAAGAVVLVFVVLRPTPARPLTDREQAEATARGYLEDVGNGRFLSSVERMCIDTPSARRAPATVIPSSSTPPASTFDLPFTASASVNSIRITGETAVVDADLVIAGTRTPVPLTLRRQGSGWCVLTGLAG